MATILVIQFRKNPVLVESERGSICRETKPLGLDVRFASALDESLSWDNPARMLTGVAGVILGGSGEYDFDGGRTECDEARAMSQVFLKRLSPFVTFLFDHTVPTLGICYGHQLIGAHQGVSVVHDATQSKVGTHEVLLLSTSAEDALFEGIPERFAAQYGHKDALSAIPDGAVLLAHANEHCRVSALRYGKHIYTVQFHPEMTAEDVALRLENSPGYLPEGVAVADVVQTSPHASRILRNFLEQLL